MKLLTLPVAMGLFISGHVLANQRISESDTMNQELLNLKTRCSQLYGNPQIKPFKVKVSCREKSYVWKVGQPIEGYLANSREVGGSFFMKDVQIPFQASKVPVGATKVQCYNLDKWEVTVPSFDIEITCSELEQVSDVTSFCRPLIDQKLAEDSSIAIAQKTNESFNTCQGLKIIQQHPTETESGDKDVESDQM